MESRDPVRQLLWRAASLGDAVAAISCLSPSLTQRRTLPSLRRSAELLLNHPPVLSGYFDGYAARSLARDSLQGELPDDASDLAVVCVACTLFARAMSEHAARPSLVVLPGGPQRPGPERTAEVAFAHVEGLFSQLSEYLALQDAPDA